MKSSRSLGLILFLIMLLLVAGAGFVFLFQAELRLRNQARELSSDNDALRAAQAEADLAIAGAEATGEAMVEALATAEHSSLLLEGQLVDSQATVDALDTRVAELDEQPATPAGTAEPEQEPPPVARIVTPLDAATLPISQPVQIVLVASDASGLSSLTLEVNGRRFSTYAVDGDKLYARTLNWNAPSTEGEVVFTVSAVNINNVRSEPQSVTITLADTEARNADIRAEVEANVSEIRGLPLLEPIVPVVLTRDELRERMGAEFAAEITPEESQSDVLELSAFDFLGRDYDLFSAQLELQSDGILGYYDPETAEFVVVNDGLLLDPAAQWTHAHEVVHALQDQHFDLDALTDDELDSEARAAVRALAEGEAELVQYFYLFESDYFTQEEFDSIANARDQTGSDFLDDYPPVLVNDLSFPYTSGVNFVVELYREGGFAAIDAAWANPPRSTEQILHPDRYHDDDRPQLVSLPPLTATLGAGWELLDEDVLGEFYLREYLAQQLPERSVEQAATGWGGDRYAVYWNAADEALVMVLRLVWDTPADALEFAAAYPAYPAALFEADGEAQGDGSTCWLGEDVICFVQVDGESLIVRAPDGATAAGVLAALR